MRIDREYAETSFEQFCENPAFAISKASQTHIEFGIVRKSIFPGTDYTIRRSTASGEVIDFILTGAFIFNAGVKVNGKSEKPAFPRSTRTENLEHYRHNSRARDRALNRVFDTVAEGNIIGIKVECEPGVNRTAFLHRADMNG